jgi:pimeloyl-ACP methyl ester carboxylesterase
MNTVKTESGYTLAYEKNGKGPNLLIIGGSLADHRFYQSLARSLSEYFTVYNYDRRNRGLSRATANHTWELELEDLETMLSITGEPVILYGHSAGAALAIRAAAKGLKIHKLILADLPYSVMDENKHASIESHRKENLALQDFISKGEKEKAVRYFMKDFGMTEEELDYYISSDLGKTAMEISPTLLIDYELLGDGLTPDELLVKIEVPTLILTSGYGLAGAQDASNLIYKAQIEILEAPTHMIEPENLAKLINLLLMRDL